MRSQEAAFKARGPRAHQGDHAAGEPGGNISSCLHSRGGAAQTRFHVQVVLRLQTLNTRTELDIASSSPFSILYFSLCQVLASFSEPQEAGGGEVLPPQQKHDPAENHEAVQTTRCKKKNASSCSLLLFAARCRGSISRWLSVSCPLHPLRAPRRLACGRWSGATSPR